jgi:hypothetical protein
MLLLVAEETNVRLQEFICCWVRLVLLASWGVISWLMKKMASWGERGADPLVAFVALGAYRVRIYRYFSSRMKRLLAGSGNALKSNDIFIEVFLL